MEASAETIILPVRDAIALARSALLSAGASEAMAAVLARATIDAELVGKPSVGLRHLVVFLESLRAGRIQGHAEPLITSPVPALMKCDSGGGISQLGFEIAFDELVTKARTFGLVIFTSHNGYTTGELGWYTARLADAGLAALAACNGPAMLATPASRRPVFCSNPLAFAAPRANGPPLVIDQASSATAFANIAEAAEREEAIPPGWAVDESGEPTTDARAAIRGALLAFGGSRGANIALMVEILAAGIGGANWSLDAPDFRSGERSPGAGLFILAIAPQLLAGDFESRLGTHLDRLSDEYGVHVPGAGRLAAREKAEREGISLPRQLFDSISSFRHR
ncbi:Ldh family oxidoreductase [Sinorhizobium sp. BG8]|uniref:Ldh family oxidoreductase n=1 Tax=Sinorhizobium sp. BG8 TaxID=2613773 RepID=UPI00193D7648|nr:Ldh family oxidoreductase [Sinorhizobium sp. BG8]QRM56349.1 Ldh family oxidoreductase [Sinorhizobium sp. BG8]